MSGLSLRKAAPADSISPQSLWNLLGISAQAPPAERTRLLLLQLEHADYLPPPAWHEAIEILAGGFSADPNKANDSFPALRQEMEDRLRDDIEQFVNRFLTLPAAQRQLEWSELHRRSEHWPTLCSRLKLLEPGLGIELLTADSAENPRVAKLLHAITELFPLGAAERRRLIGELLVPMRDDPHRWESAAFALARSHPELTRIVPEFLVAVTSLCDPEREDARRSEIRAEANAVWAPKRVYHGKTPVLGLRFWANYSHYWLEGLFFGIPLLFVFVALVCEYTLNTKMAKNTSRTNGTSAGAPDAPLDAGLEPPKKQQSSVTEEKSP